jgi:hypothetical protein
MHNLFLVYFFNFYVFRAYLGPSSGGTTYVCNNLYLLFFLDDCCPLDNRESPETCRDWRSILRISCTYVGFSLQDKNKTTKILCSERFIIKWILQNINTTMRTEQTCAWCGTEADLCKQENKLSSTIKRRIFLLSYILLASYETISSTQLLIIPLVK